MFNDGQADVETWMRAAYSDRTLVTSVAGAHADQAQESDRPAGRPTSSSTLPGLVVQMLRHLRVYDGADVLDVGTGSGYGCALLAARLGGEHVTSVDVDPYLTAAAVHRLEQAGLRPEVATIDATGPLPGDYDRIVATVSVRPIPASWLAALRPGGRLVTTITGTTLIITADKSEDGGAVGRVEWDRAGFMAARHDAGDYPSSPHALPGELRDREGDHISEGRYPVLDVVEAWEVRSMLDVTVPGIEHHYEEYDDGRRSAWMSHKDGSWARATGIKGEAPIVHQGGPRRLWDALDSIRHRWVMTGSLPVHGARVSITPDGVCHLKRGRWEAGIA
ncbi:methyltransferase domain-containing protein [Sphaerisporangium perillae]|uniref:methyltransferase domain-containing protein n=1 Tax=Sphaerisporangium perillae TaxID=2935860 RepID=UPI00200DE397|nr:methyltransferase domain-containing protein [Sphaerisporangium perillae]